MKFEEFLKEFIPEVARKSKELNEASWLLETTGSADAVKRKADLDTEVRLLFQDPHIYQKLLAWDKEPLGPIQKRELNVLIRTFKQNQVPKPLLEEVSQKEALLAQSYANFRPELEGKKLSENEIRTLLKKETDPAKRKAVWEASKQIGPLLAPQILALVHLRNQVAHTLGYSDYFQMQLKLQEVDPKWLLTTLEELSQKSEKAYEKTLFHIEQEQGKKFQVPLKELGPWAWADPFCQEDPLESHALDVLVEKVDLVEASRRFYEQMGIDVKPILAQSDLYERPGKNQHAFCTNIDRGLDVRTLNNIQPSIRWLSTLLHELGHAIYELGFDTTLPWLLREPPHMIPTEAMALIAGRQAYRAEALAHLVGPDKEALRKKGDESLLRQQLIFSRWVLVMTAFESELYRDPAQDLNTLWWKLVEKYQKVKQPQNRSGSSDWATKYHIGLAPVYYFSYLLGELFASSIQESLQKECGTSALNTPQAGQFLQKKLFRPGNSFPWSDLVTHVTGKPLTPDAWLREFAQN